MDRPVGRSTGLLWLRGFLCPGSSLFRAGIDCFLFVTELSPTLFDYPTNACYSPRFKM